MSDPAAIEAVPSAAAAIRIRERQLREEWDVAEARGFFAAAATSLPHIAGGRGVLHRLEDLLDDVLADDGHDGSDTSAARRVLLADLAEFLEERRGRRRSTAARLSELRYKLSSIGQVVADGDPVLERRRIDEAVVRGYDPLQRDDAIAELRELVDVLDPRRAPDHLALSRALRLAGLLRLRGTAADIDEARRLTDTAVQWRSRAHGAEHPLTLAARMAATRNALEPLEARRDEGPLGLALGDRVEEAADLANALFSASARVLGGHHAATVGALACVARAARLGDRSTDARLHAERALALSAGRDERADAGVPAILRFLVAEAEAVAALGAAALGAARPGAPRPTRSRDPRIGRALALLDEATAAIGHRLSLAPWNNRIERLRASLR